MFLFIIPNLKTQIHHLKVNQTKEDRIGLEDLCKNEAWIELNRSDDIFSPHCQVFVFYETGFCFIHSFWFLFIKKITYYLP